MAIQKDECPAGGKHAWGQVNPGTWKCSKCGAIRKTGNKNTATKSGEVNISTLLLILVVIVGVWYFFAKGKDKNTAVSSAGAPQAQVTPEPPKPAAAPQPTQPSTRQAPDPVAMLKPLLTHLQENYSKKVNKDNGAIAYVEWCTPSNVRYDVRQTQSLVSPYTAIITFTEHHQYTVTKDYKGDNPMFAVGNTLDSGYNDYRVTLAMQDGQWVLTDVQYQSWSKDLGVIVKWRGAYENQIARIAEGLGLQ